MPSTGHLLDALVVLWLLLLAGNLTLALRTQDRRDVLASLALLALSLLARFALPWGLSNWYYSAPWDGPFPDAFVGSHPVVFDSDLRFLAAIPGATDSWLFALRTCLGAMVAPLLFLSARRLGTHKKEALAFGLMLALWPYLLWISRTEALHAWPLACLATAVFGLALRTRLGLFLALVSMLLGAGIRIESAPALIASFLLAWALTEHQRVPWRLWLTIAAVAAGLSALLYWGPYWGQVVGNPDFAGSGENKHGILGALFGVCDPTLPPWFWWGLVVPGSLAGLVLWACRRAWQPIVAIGAGLAVAVLPAAITGRPLNDTGNARYIVLALPFLLLPLSRALSAAAHALSKRAPGLAGRSAAAFVVVALPLGAIGVAAPTLLADVEWELEYRFLRDNLDELPLGCQVVALEHRALEAPATTTDLTLAQPHPLLRLARPDLRWESVPLGEASLLPAAGCRAFFFGVACALAQDDTTLENPAARTVASQAAAPCHAMASFEGGTVVAEKTVHPAGDVPGRHPPATKATQTMHFQLVLWPE